MLGASTVALLAIIGAGPAFAQATGEGIETVTVTGFRQSLEKALDMKRAALDSSDSIMAEDIAKFPDLNVSESLQRIPGVALQRDAGEGRQISVRGLGPQFTRVRINGMEAMATTGGADASGGTNRGRSFDFNVFGSELFSGLTVHKSASAEIEEGSLGATVDMRTARPFDYNKFVLATSLQAGYNDLAGTVNPRASFLISDTFMGGRLGVLFSAAYNVRHIIEDGTSTVRWQNDNTARAADGSAPGVTGCASGCKTNQRFKSVMTLTNGAEYDLVNEAFRPRFARYDLYRDAEKRLGLSTVVQWQPDDHTLFTLSGLFSDFAAQRDETYLEANVWSTSGTGGVGGVDVTGYHVDTATNTLDYVAADNVDLRVEHRVDHLDTRFMQASLEGSHEFSDAFKVNILAGWAESHHRNPVQTTLTYDLWDIQDYSYDYRGDYAKVPAFDYGSADVTSSGSTAGVDRWYLSQIRIRPQEAFHSFRTAQADAAYNPYDWLSVKAGVDFKQYGYRTSSRRLSDGSTSNYETVETGFFTGVTGAAATYYGSTLTTILATPLSSYSMLAHFPTAGLNIPTGTPTTWLEPDINKAQELFDIYALPTSITPQLGNNRAVHEDDYGGWLQVGWDTLFYGVPFRGNIGGRYVLTEQSATGWNLSGSAYVLSTTDHSYHNFLPSLNMVFEPADDFLIRLNAAQVMARPDLGQLVGTSVSVSGSNRTVTVGNPGLKPFQANTIDLSYEWYYHKGAMLSVALFYKKIGTYIQTYSASLANGTDPFVPPFGGVPVTLDASVLAAACGSVPGCSPTASWTVTESINTPGGSLDGIELNWQQPFDFLPHPLDSFGVLGNVTYVDSSILNGTGTTAAKTTLVNQSRVSYNATMYYDDTVFQARLSASYRGKYLTNNPGRNLNDVEGMTATFNLDASASYKWDDNFTVTFDALNMTNQFQDQWVDSVAQRLSVYHQTGSEYYLGLRYNY